MTAEAGLSEQATDTSACRVFGIVPADAVLPSWNDEGVAARDIRIVAHDGVGAVIEEVDQVPATASRGDLVAHGLVLNSLATEGIPVIPVRFGSVMESREDVVEELIAPSHEHWSDLLEEYRGRCQFTLRARYEQEAVLREILQENPQIAELREQTSGQPEDASYADRVRLGQLVADAMTDKRATDIEALESPLLDLCETHRTSPGSGLDNVADIAFLVDDEQRDFFEEAAENLAGQQSGRISLRLLGPLAPFDFVPEEPPWA